MLTIDWTSRTATDAGGGPVFAFPRGALILVGLIALGAGLGEGAAVDWSAVFLADVLGAAEAHATLGYAVFSVTMVAMRLCVDRLITRHGPQRVALASFVLMGMGYAAVIPLAFSRAAADPIVPAGQAIASVATLGYGAMLMGPPAIGFIADANSLRVSFALVGLFALLIAALSPVLGRARPAPRVS